MLNEPGECKQPRQGLRARRAANQTGPHPAVAHGSSTGSEPNWATTRQSGETGLGAHLRTQLHACFLRSLHAILIDFFIGQRAVSGTENQIERQ